MKSVTSGEFQIILISFLLHISYKSQALAKRCPI